MSTSPGPAPFATDSSAAASRPPRILPAWLARKIAAIEALEDIEFDADILARVSPQGWVERPLAAATPSFRTYHGSALEGCTRASFPAFSITGGACSLDCDHCQAGILKPMIPATVPERFEARVRCMIRDEGLRGFLLSGGSNRRNEMPIERYLPAIERLKRDFPFLRIACHTALMDERRARLLAAAGIDTAMMDVIGAPETIRDVYHLDRPVADFEATLAALCAAKLNVVPHVVIGLHYGRVLGEFAAIDIVARHPVDGLVLVVLMPHYARPDMFVTPSPEAVASVFAYARRALADKKVLLGCARPPGLHRRAVDAYAVLLGLDGIAFPADGAVELARGIGRPVRQDHACCSVSLGGGGCP